MKNPTGYGPSGTELLWLTYSMIYLDRCSVFHSKTASGIDMHEAAVTACASATKSPFVLFHSESKGDDHMSFDGILSEEKTIQ